MNCFNETVALDLREWASSTWFLRLIDHLTRFIVSRVIKSKHKEVIVKNLIEICTSVFGSPENNHEFSTLCENININI